MKNAMLIVAGIVFLIVAALHLVRVLLKWDVVVAGADLPLSLSIAGFSFALALAILMFWALKTR